VIKGICFLAITRFHYITLVKIFRLKRKPGSYKYMEFNIKPKKPKSLYMYKTHIRAGVGNDILKISGMVYIEGTEIQRNLILNSL
jgi:hypothetical protein